MPLLKHIKMKQIELELQERLLLVEGLDIKEIHEKLKHYTDFHELKLICKGDELTEEVAKGLADTMNFGTKKNPHVFYLNHKNDLYQFGAALQSFISAIEGKGYFWGENPFEKPSEKSNFYFKEMDDYLKAESRTFNPSRTLIFKIS